MAIQDNTPGNDKSTPMGEAMATARTSRPDNTQSNEQRSSFSFRNPSGFGPKPIGRNIKSDVVVKLAEALNKVFEGSAPGYECTVLGLDKENNVNLGVSLIVVAVSDKTKPALGVAYHILLCEATTEAPLPRYETVTTIGGQQTSIEILRFVSDQFNQHMINVVTDELSKRFPNIRLISADAALVPRDFNVADEVLVNNLATNAMYAAGTVLTESDRDFQDLNLANVARDSTLVLRPSYANNTLDNAVGHPIRADITLKLQSVTNQAAGMEGLESTVNVFEAAAFVDLLYAPPEAQQLPYGYPQGQVGPTQKYLPRIVVTKLESAGALTMGVQLLGLAQLATLRNPGSWMQTFFTHGPASKSKDIRDIGYLNIEGNLERDPSGFGGYVDTKSTNFTPADMGRYLSSLVRQDGVIISQDIPHCDPSSWYNSFLLAVARGSQAAYKKMYDRANTLTNGAFANHFKEGTPMVVTNNERQLLGFYLDANGEQRDVRDIDLIAVLAMEGEKNPAYGMKWTETFLNLNVPENVRLSDRKAIISNLVNPTFTGVATRVDYTAAFLDALVAACADAGLDVKQSQSFQNFSGQERHTASFNNGILQNSSMTTGFINRNGGGTTAPQGGNVNSGFNRWM